jgi:hypothetical protein
MMELDHGRVGLFRKTIRLRGHQNLLRDWEDFLKNKPNGFNMCPFDMVSKIHKEKSQFNREIIVMFLQILERKHQRNHSITKEGFYRIQQTKTITKPICLY